MKSYKIILLIGVFLLFFGNVKAQYNLVCPLPPEIDFDITEILPGSDDEKANDTSMDSSDIKEKLNIFTAKKSENEEQTLIVSPAVLRKSKLTALNKSITGNY